MSRITTMVCDACGERAELASQYDGTPALWGQVEMFMHGDDGPKGTGKLDVCPPCLRSVEKIIRRHQ